MGSWHCLPAWGCPLCVCFNWKLIVRGLLWKWYHCLQTANPAFCKETLVVLFVLVDLRSSKAWRRKGDANILLKKKRIYIFITLFLNVRYQVFFTFVGRNEYKLLNFMLIATTLLSSLIRHYCWRALCYHFSECKQICVKMLFDWYDNGNYPLFPLEYIKSFGHCIPYSQFFFFFFFEMWKHCKTVKSWANFFKGTKQTKCVFLNILYFNIHNCLSPFTWKLLLLRE